METREKLLFPDEAESITLGLPIHLVETREKLPIPDKGVKAESDASGRAGRNRRSPDHAGEADGLWRQGWDLTEKQIAFFREKSVASAKAKRLALSGQGRRPMHPINEPRLNPLDLMPFKPSNGFRTLSLFSGGGGLDLGFDLAGYTHVASYDILPIAEKTLKRNRPAWVVYAGEERGNVCRQDWNAYRGIIDVLHGGPPCQPFSSAGRQMGSRDTRDMFPEFVRAVLASLPRAFVAENVAALSQEKFQAYFAETVCQPLSGEYHFVRFELKAEWFGVPQQRNRLFFVGFRSRKDFDRFRPPDPTHAYPGTAPAEPSSVQRGLFADLEWGSKCKTPKLRTMAVREALGLPEVGYDNLAPTLRSGFSGPRGATSVNNSKAALKAWGQLGIWPHGVAPDRESAQLFVPENDNFRLSVLDCAVLQGFPEDWEFCGPVYAVLGQIGNSVAPPMAYRVALAVAEALKPTSDNGT